MAYSTSDPGSLESTEWVDINFDALRICRQRDRAVMHGSYMAAPYGSPAEAFYKFMGHALDETLWEDLENE